MKNLIITLSFFLLLPLTGHANGLMKFKKVKQGEKAAPTKTTSYSAPVATQPAINIEYAMGLRNALVKFMIQLEKDVEAKKVSRSEAEKILQLLRNNLFVAEAFAQPLLKTGSQCFVGGWTSTIQSNGDCAMHPDALRGCTGSNMYRCNDNLFGNNVCVPQTAKGRGFTAECARTSNPETLRQEILANPERFKAIQMSDADARKFCSSWKATHNNNDYNGCKELMDRTAALSAAAPNQTAQQDVKTAPAKEEPKTAPAKEEPSKGGSSSTAATTTVQQQRVQAPQGNGEVTPGENCKNDLAASFARIATTQPVGKQAMNSREECGRIKQQMVNNLNRVTTNTAFSNEQRQSAVNDLNTIEAQDCSKICSDPEEEKRNAAAKEENDRQNEAARIPGQPKARRMGSAQGTRDDYGCFNKAEMQGVSCLNTLQKSTSENEDVGLVGTGTQKNPFFKPIERDVDLENPHSFVRYFMGQQDGIASALTGYEASITPNKFCRLLASGCKTPTTPEGIVSYNLCVSNAETNFIRPLTVGVEKTIAIVAAARETTKFESDDNYGGNPFECKGNKGDNAGLGFDHPKCKSFYNWYVALEATSTGFKVGNEAAVTTENMRNQTRLQQQIEEGNGQDAGFEASRNASIASQKAEERNMGFFAAKGAAILAQLNNWPKRENVCDRGCCALFTAEGADRIDRDFFPNADAKNHIYAQAIAAATEVMVAKFKADLHKDNARKVQAIKEQMQFTDDSEEGVMKFCVQFPQDVRCLSPGQRRALGASGTQFGSFQGSNFGLGSLEGEQGNEVSAGQDFGGSLAAGGPSGNVGNIGSADKDAAAAKNIFNAPAAARGGGGGGAGGGAGGGGGGGGSAQSGQLSRDEGLKEDKKESPIEITSKKAAYEGSKGGYNGGGYNPSNKKPGESPTANPFAGMFGKDQGRDPANVAEIDKPASDLFSKISRRYGEVQKRKALMEVADEGNGIR